MLFFASERGLGLPSGLCASACKPAGHSGGVILDKLNGLLVRRYKLCFLGKRFIMTFSGVIAGSFRSSVAWCRGLIRLVVDNRSWTCGWCSLSRARRGPATRASRGSCGAVANSVRLSPRGRRRGRRQELFQVAIQLLVDLWPHGWSRLELVQTQSRL